MCLISKETNRLGINRGLVVHLIGFVLIGSTSASCFLGLFKGSSVDPVTKLSAYLVDNESSDDLYANIVAAKRLNQLSQSGARDESFVEVARQFIALEQINRDNMCHEGIEILDKLSASLRTYGKKPFKGSESRRRLNLLVIQQAIKHFKACFKSMDLAWGKLEKRHAEEDPPTDLNHKLRFLTSLTDEIIYFHYFHPPTQKHDNMHAGVLIRKMDKHVSIEALRIALDKRVKQEVQINGIQEVDKKTGKLVRTEETVLKYLNEYFWAPCEYLVRELDDNRKDLLDRAFKLIYAANLKIDRELYLDFYFSNLLEWVTNLSTCKRLLLRPSKEALARQINWSQMLG